MRRADALDRYVIRVANLFYEIDVVSWYNTIVVNCVNDSSQCAFLRKRVVFRGKEFEVRKLTNFWRWKGKMVMIPLFVEEIEECCFFQCERVSRIAFELGIQIRKIGKYAFSRCSFRSIRFPGSLETLEERVVGNDSLVEISFEADSNLRKISDSGFVNVGNKVEVIEFPRKCRISSGQSLDGLEYCTFSKDNEFHFTENDLLCNKDSKTLIRYLGSESEICVRKFVKRIGPHCFNGKKDVREVWFEAGCEVTDFGEHAFYSSGVQSILIPSSVQTIGPHCFHFSDLCEIAFERRCQVAEFGPEAFRRCKLRSIVFPSCVKTIGYRCFFECKKLSEVTFEADSEMTDIGAESFSSCRFESIIIPSSVRMLGKKCFCKICRLRGVVFDPCCQITELDMCFCGCDELCEVVFKAPCNIVLINERTFYECPITEITIPSSVREIGKECFLKCKNLTEIMFDPGSELSEIGKSAFCQSGLQSIRIPSLLRRIPQNCFQGCESLREVTFESNCKITVFEAYAFAGTGLVSIKVPVCVKRIGKFCFLGCENLCEVSFETSCELRIIEESAFSDCGMRSITIPDCVEEIGQTCFQGCQNLTEIAFAPNSKVGRRKQLFILNETWSRSLTARECSNFDTRCK
jgi:hypothetical protein